MVVTQHFINLVPPIHPKDAVNKAYVDGYINNYVTNSSMVSYVSAEAEILSQADGYVNIEKDGYTHSINKIVFGPDIDISISGTEASLKSKTSDFCIGDLSVASEIVNPTTPIILAHLGDSRTSILTDTILQGYAPNLQWSGIGFNWSDYPQSWKSVTVYNQATVTAVTTPWGDLGTLTPHPLHVHTLNGGTTGHNSQLSQYFYSTYTPGTYALYQLRERVLRYYMLLLEGPHGVTTDDLRLMIDYVGGMYTGSYFSTYAASVGVKVVYIDIPNTHNWTTYGSLYPKLEHRYSTATTNGQQVVMLGAAFVPIDAGVCRINCAVGGRRTESYSDQTIFNSSLWSSYFSNFGSNYGLLIDLGTNGSGNLDTAEEDTANKIIIANRFREQFPNGPILFTTAYSGGIGGLAGELPGCSRGWRDGAIAAAASIPHSLVIDTFNAMPTAAQALALGYYAGGDYVHYSTLGSQTLAAVISEILRKAASRNS